jgi:Zn-dependent protease
VQPWAWIAFLPLILWHELGHALLARALGHHIQDVAVAGWGGLCGWSGRPSAGERAWVAAGGLLAQALLLAVALTYEQVHGPVQGDVAGQLLLTAVRTNLWIGAINLLPLGPLDGAGLWRALGEVLRQARARRRQVRRLRALADRDELADDPDAFADEAREMLRQIRDDAARSAPPAKPPTR